MQDVHALVMSAGLHGAKVAIMGRRQQVIQDSAEKLQSEGVEAVGVQVLYTALNASQCNVRLVTACVTTVKKL